MRRGRKIVSIDVGNYSFKSLVFSETASGEYELLKSITLKTHGIENGEIKDAVSLREVLEKLISEIQEVVKLESSDVVISTSCGKFNLRNFQKEMIISEGEKKTINEDTVEQLRGSLIEEIQTTERVLHFYPKKYVIDKSKVVFNPLDMMANSLAAEYAFVTVDKSSSTIFEFLEEYFPTEATFAVSSITSSEGVLTDTEKETGACLVDLGHFSTSVIVYTHGVPIRFESVALGMRHVLKDVSLVLNTSLEESERLLKTHGCAVFGDTVFAQQSIEYKGLDGMTVRSTNKDFLARIIHARLREILTKVKRIYREEATKVSELGLKGLPGGIILIGGGAKVPRLLDLAIDIFKNPVRIGTYNVSSNIPVKNAEDVIDDPAYNAVLGNLASYVTKETPAKAKSRKKATSEGFFKKLTEILKNLW